MASSAGAMQQSDVIAPGVTISEVPGWVHLSPLKVKDAPDPRFVVAGLCVLLDDAQSDLCGAQPAEFYRRADWVVDGSGAQHAARFAAEFDPQYERLEIHFVRIHRAGAVLERAKADAFEVLRRERNLEARQFDGRLTVHLEIPDVRVGDIVETAWTLFGESPALRGRFSGWRPFEWSPTGQLETRYRLRVPPDRIIQTKVFGGEPPDYHEEILSDGLVDRRWTAAGREGRSLEPLAPPWTFQLARLQLSEWRSWGELAQRFLALYTEEQDLPEELATELQHFSALATPEEKAAAVLRFVQSRVRYLAVSIGSGAVVPRPIGTIWETRFGDCKDVTKLFVRLARAIGLDAHPALVHTVVGPAIDLFLPSAHAFNHCMIRLRIGPQTYWLDATLPPQPSPLQTLHQPRFGWALPLAPDTDSLEHMGEDNCSLTSEIEEEITLPPTLDQSAKHALTMVSRDWRAESLRHELAQNGELAYFRGHEERMRSIWPKASLEVRSIEDDTKNNQITVRMQFATPEAWDQIEGGNVSYVARDPFMGNFFAPLDAGESKLPLYLGVVGQARRIVNIHSPVEVLIENQEVSIIHESVSVLSKLLARNPKHLYFEQQVKIRRNTMPGEDAQKYRDMVRELRLGDLIVRAKVKKGKIRRADTAPKRKTFSWWWIWIGLVVLGNGARYLLSTASQ